MRQRKKLRQNGRWDRKIDKNAKQDGVEGLLKHELRHLDRWQGRWETITDETEIKTRLRQKKKTDETERVLEQKDRRYTRKGR